VTAGRGGPSVAGMSKTLLAAALAGALASGCTVLAPVISNGVQSTPRRGDAKAERAHDDVQTVAVVLGAAADIVLIALAVDFADTLEHSGD
jgi:hypothetical protein